MKKIIVCYLTFINLTACLNRDKNEDLRTKTESIKSFNDQINQKVIIDSSLISEFKNSKIFSVSDTINSDLNGDGINDHAYFTDIIKRELIIIDGKSRTITKIGDDISFDKIGKDFKWVDFWGITTDHETFEVIIQDNEIVNEQKYLLNYNSLFLRKNDVGGGVITFRNGKFVWIHQAD
jgi:hypothetical protein